MTTAKICDLSDGYALHSHDGEPAVMTQCGNTFVCSAREAFRLALDRSTGVKWHRRVSAWLGANPRLRDANDPRWRAAAQAEISWRAVWHSAPNADATNYK